MRWNIHEIGNRLELLWKKAERNKNNASLKIKKAPLVYRPLFDSSLAMQIIIDNCMSSIDTPKSMLSTLNSLKDHPDITDEVYDQDKFVERWNLAIDKIIGELSLEDYENKNI